MQKLKEINSNINEVSYNFFEKQKIVENTSTIKNKYFITLFVSLIYVSSLFVSYAIIDKFVFKPAINKVYEEKQIEIDNLITQILSKESIPTNGYKIVEINNKKYVISKGNTVIIGSDAHK